MKPENTPWIMCAFFFGVVGVLCLGFGIASVINGTEQLDEASSVDPSKDFYSLGEICRINGTHHDAEDKTESCTQSGTGSRSGVKKWCEDWYWWDFTVPDVLEGLVTSVSTTPKARCIPGCSGFTCTCGETQPIDAPVSVGDVTECWAPTDLSTLSDVYACGNEGCYKILSPHAEVANLAQDGEATVATGYRLIASGCSFLFIFCCTVKCLRGNVEKPDAAVSAR